MKLAILGTRGIPAHYGGFETFAERLGTGLAARGWDVTVYCEGSGKGKPSRFEGVHLEYVPAPDIGSLSTVLYDARCLWKARERFDVVFMLGYGAAPFCLIPRLWKREVWINPDGLEWARHKWNGIAKKYFQCMEWTSMRVADRIVADAQAIAEHLSRRHGRLQSCSVIPYGCEIVDAPPPNRLLDEWRVDAEGYYLIVCRLEPENHVLEILRAFQQCGSKRQLLVAGNLRRNGYVEKLRSVKDPRIRMIGTVYEREKLASLRYHSFAYFHGHSVGGTNPSLLEAMGCGNLIFAHDNPFNRETLGGCGLYFGRVNELVSGIAEAESRNGELAWLRNAAKSRARENYRWSDVIDSYERLLKRTLARAA
jgi:glycosyltransferase involved in cell wall biosynthesis